MACQAIANDGSALRTGHLHTRELTASDDWYAAESVSTAAASERRETLPIRLPPCEGQRQAGQSHSPLAS